MYLLIALVLSFSTQTAQPPTDLHDLFRRHDWFALRAAGPLRDISTLLAGAVEAAFGDFPQAERDLNATVQADPKSSAAYVSHSILADSDVRMGRYQEALRETDLALAIRPDDSDALNRRTIVSVLAQSPDQSVTRNDPHPSTLVRAGGALLLPVIINGSPCQYMMDTGANFSTMSESEAQRLHLEIQDTGATVSDVLGRKLAVKVAVANRMLLAGCELANVAWLVTPDSQPPFNHMAEGKRGIVGLPVLYALGRIHWEKSGRLEVGGTGASNTGVPNLCFEGLTPVTQIEVHDVKVPAMLDTGAMASALWPLFEQRFPDIIRTSKIDQADKIVGAAGTANVNVDLIPELEMKIAGYPARLSPAHVLRSIGRDAAKWEYGNIGTDVLNQAESVTIDFRNMTLTLN